MALEPQVTKMDVLGLLVNRWDSWLAGNRPDFPLVYLVLLSLTYVIIAAFVSCAIIYNIFFNILLSKMVE